MLPEERRIQLDGIVNKMLQNKEPDENIQFVVDDFKKKYSTQNIVPPEKGVIQKTVGAVKDLGIGAVKGTVETLQNIGKVITDPLSEAMGGGETGFTEEQLEGKNAAQKAGKFIERVAEFAVPLSKISKATKGASILKRALAEGTASAGVESVQQGEINKETAISGVVGGGIPVAGKVADFGLGIAKRLFKGVASGISGAGSDVIETIFTRPNDAAKGLKGDGAEVVKELAQTVLKETKAIQKEASQAYSDGLKSIIPNVIKGDKKSFYVTREGRKTISVPLTMQGVRTKLSKNLKNFGVDFSKDDPFLESPFVGDEQTALQRVSGIIKNWKDTTPEGLNDLAVKIGRFKKFESATQFNSVIDSVKKNVRDYVGDRVPEIRELNIAFGKTQDFLEAIEANLGATSGFSGTQDIIKVAGKLGTIFNRNKELAREVVERLEQERGINVLGVEAGRQLSTQVQKSTASIGSPLQSFIQSLISPTDVGRGVQIAGQVVSSEKVKTLQNLFSKATPAEKGALIEIFSSLFSEDQTSQ